MRLSKFTLQYALLILIAFFPLTENSKAAIGTSIASQFDEYSAKLYLKIGDTDLKQSAFNAALKGYLNLKEKKMVTSDIISIADYTISGNQKRFFVIDLKEKKVLYKTLIAHGKNSGMVFPRQFSNEPNSFKSSLGFFVTGEKFMGTHGNSLRLDGIESSINHNARDRGIIVHAADYVSEDFISKNGHLGRSQGCPALPYELNDEIIDLIKDKTCFFIYYPDKKYLTKSAYINKKDYLNSMFYLASE